MGFYELAEQFFADEEYQKAFDIFEKLFETENNYDVLNYMGCCLMYLGKYAEALQIFDKVIEANPKWESPLCNKGRIYLKLNDYKRALPVLKKVIEMNPGNEGAFYYLGLYYERVGEYEKARLNYKKSLFINQKQLETRVNLGNIYYKLGNFKEAKKEFEIAYDQDNNFLDALINIGLINSELEKYDEAIDCLKKALQHLPDDTAVLYDLAWVYFKQGKVKNSLVLIEKLLNKDPEHQMGLRLKEVIESEED